MKDEDLIWQKKGKKELLKTRVLTVTEIESVSPENETGNFIVMDAPDWVMVIPEIDGDFLMVKQWRHGENNLSIEFPGGVMDAGESPEDAARRELLEETGYKSNELIYLGKANPNPAIMSNHVHFFAAKNLVATGKQELDDEEFVDYMRIPKEEVCRNFGNPEYSHALMMAALLKYMTCENK
ncbi:MAG: NUDIX hydrolase [Treponema sp.]|nr:NUDIX hydrolase [Candidatus Treponema equifaecale]